MTDPNLAFLREIVTTVQTNLTEIKDRKNFAEAQELEYIEGKLQAYQEIHSMLKTSANEFGISPHDIGL